MNNKARNPKPYFEYNHTPPFPGFLPNPNNLVAIYQSAIFPSHCSYDDETQRFFTTEVSTETFVCCFWLDFIEDNLPYVEMFSRDLLSCINHLTPVRYTAHRCGEHIYVRCAVSSAPCYPLYKLLINGSFPGVLEYWLEDTMEGY